jgi:hypothetical protein
MYSSPKENNCQPRSLYPAKWSFIDKEIKTFHNKQKLKQFKTTRPALQKILKGILHRKEKDKHNQENTGKKNSH